MVCRQSVQSMLDQSGLPLAPRLCHDKLTSYSVLQSGALSCCKCSHPPNGLQR